MKKTSNPVNDVKELCKQDPRKALNYLRDHCCGEIDMTAPNAEKEVKKMVRTMVSTILNAFRNVALENGGTRTTKNGKIRAYKTQPILGPRSHFMNSVHAEVMAARDSVLKQYGIKPVTAYNPSNYSTLTTKLHKTYINPSCE